MSGARTPSGASKTQTIPPYNEFMWPVLDALKALGGSATVQEMYEWVVADKAFTEDQQAVLRKDGKLTLISDRLHWARSYLKKIDVVENSSRGVWTITEKGRNITPAQIERELKVKRASELQSKRAEIAVGSAELERATKSDDPEIASTWREELLARVLETTPEGFERLAQRILREAGFVNVNVTGKSGDGGIDGVGVYRMSLVSFPVFFQCKRYKGSVTAGDVRDFKGAMLGRGEKGLLITVHP
ncbi:MAG: winged helix-turn-helix domain-containing protein [Acidimicrobiales bacterium]